ncbi:MAG: PmoA family protein [Verrucomicrobiota bacterium]
MPYQFQRCEIIPQANHQTTFQIDGQEKIRWHHDHSYPRPFFYPLPGPSGSSLTRIGHPGASNHEHHRSVWFAHHDVGGHDFWSDNRGTRIVEKMWLAYNDGPDECIMATLLEWQDAKGDLLMEQELVASLIPGNKGELLFELQSTFKPNKEILKLGKTNFGFLAVRVAKSISSYFGGGQITNSEGQSGEPAIFGQAAEWMDYSGPVPVVQKGKRTAVTEGITFFDHPDNPRFPSHWHVREDGWMGASLCMHEALAIKKTAPLKLRYLLHTHAGPVDTDRAHRQAKNFAQRPGFSVAKGQAKHHQFEVKREQ